MANITYRDFLQQPSTEKSLLPNSQVIAGSLALRKLNGASISDKLGAIIKDTGFSKVGATAEANKTITGLHNFRQSETVQKLLVAINNSGDTAMTLKYLNGAVWTDVSLGATWNGFEDCKTEFLSFDEYCFIVGYDSNDNVFLPVGTLKDTTFSTSAKCTNMPKAKYIERYYSGVFVANVEVGSTRHSNRVYYGLWDDVTSDIVWNTTEGTGNYFTCDYSEAITGIKSNWNTLIIFDSFSAHAVNNIGTQTVIRRKIWKVGCQNNRTIQNFSTYMFFGNVDGIYLSQGGSEPINISYDITELVRNSDVTKWTSAIVDEEYVLYLGDTSANGVGYENLVVIYNIKTLSWRWREVLRFEPSILSINKESDGRIYLYSGSVSGEVFKKPKKSSNIFDDDTYPIIADIETFAFDFGLPQVDKKINKITVYSENGMNVEVFARVINTNTVVLDEVNIPYEYIGTLDKMVNEFNTDLRGRFFQLAFREISRNKPFSIQSITFEVI